MKNGNNVCMPVLMNVFLSQLICCRKFSSVSCKFFQAFMKCILQFPENCFPVQIFIILIIF